MKYLLLAILALCASAQTPQNKIDLLIRQGQLTAAESSARQYRQSHTDSADGHFLLGYVLFLESKAKESLAEYTEGAKYQAPSAQDLKVVASDYVVLGDFADADKWFTKVVEWTPTDVQAWYDLGRTKYNENRFEEAVTAFKKTLLLDPANAKAEDNLGLSYAALGNNDEAATAYRRAITLDAKSTASLDFGSLLIEDNRVQEALPLLTQALAIAPDDYRVHRELGKAYLHLNQLEKASTELQKAIALSPQTGPLHFMLAQVYRKQGLIDKAKLETERYTSLSR